jgi:hypothetical protein
MSLFWKCELQKCLLIWFQYSTSFLRLLALTLTENRITVKFQHQNTCVIMLHFPNQWSLDLSFRYFRLIMEFVTTLSVILYSYWHRNFDLHCVFYVQFKFDPVDPKNFLIFNLPYEFEQVVTVSSKFNNHRIKKPRPDLCCQPCKKILRANWVHLLWLLQLNAWPTHFDGDCSLAYPLIKILFTYPAPPKGTYNLILSYSHSPFFVTPKVVGLYLQRFYPRCIFNWLFMDFFQI